MYDAVIVGGGPAGLSAAIQFGRARRWVLLYDAGTPRNARATRVNALVPHDGRSPAEFRSASHESLAAYPSVERQGAWVDGVEPLAGGGFQVSSRPDSVEAAQVLLTTGVVDVPFDLPGVDEFWGHSIYQCPFCHGWEVREQPLGYIVGSREEIGFGHVLALWSGDLTLLTNGAFDLPPDERAHWESAGIKVETATITGLHGRNGTLEQIEFDDDRRIECRAIFGHNPQEQTALVQKIGPALDAAGMVAVRRDFWAMDAPGIPFETSVPGVFAAGDLISVPQAAVLAMSEGAIAGRMMLRAAAMNA